MIEKSIYLVNVFIFLLKSNNFAVIRFKYKQIEMVFLGYIIV